ncbi:MAG: hypothetical protein R2706_08900 [Acidimicrobiales bacterium]
MLCQRPLVIVGGELSSQMLDLQYDQVSGVYTAPIQMQANNGILVVDDFGRQQISPTEVLNRWIVPLSRGIDFLRLVNGVKFTIPFELKLVASTNLDPNDPGDDAPSSPAEQGVRWADYRQRAQLDSRPGGQGEGHRGDGR